MDLPKLFLLLALSCLGCSAGQSRPPVPDSPNPRDYRSRTIYFPVTDRFNAHQPYSPYVDPDYPTATNSVNCFVESCTDEVEFKKYCGGDIQDVIKELGYLKDLGVGPSADGAMRPAPSR